LAVERNGAAQTMLVRVEGSNDGSAR
jgi:hypothetical protein